MPVHMDSEVYNMSHPKRGKALIFNHEVHNLRFTKFVEWTIK
jgi:hypothetical protein